jgi:hypothetical protein
LNINIDPAEEDHSGQDHEEREETHDVLGEGVHKNNDLLSLGVGLLLITNVSV